MVPSNPHGSCCGVRPIGLGQDESVVAAAELFWGDCFGWTCSFRGKDMLVQLGGCVGCFDDVYIVVLVWLIGMNVPFFSTLIAGSTGVSP